MMTSVSYKKANEGWADFKGLTLTSPNKLVRPGGNSSKKFFGPSLCNKQAIRPRLGLHGLNFWRPSFAKSKAQEGGWTHYGGNKHTKDTCFQLHRYPEWWYKLKGKKKKERDGYTIFVTNTNPNTLVSFDSQP
jgi:hypothetical protein